MGPRVLWQRRTRKKWWRQSSDSANSADDEHWDARDVLISEKTINIFSFLSVRAKYHPMARRVRYFGDITKLDVDVIVQQCNCLTVNSHGLSEVISNELGVNIYSHRTHVPGTKNLACARDRGMPGTCVMADNETRSHSNVCTPKRVACLLAQYAPGKSGRFYAKAVADAGLKDDAAERISWFRLALKELGEVIREDGTRNVAFPKFIGCGLAGGDHETYMAAVAEFQASLGSEVCVHIVSHH